MKLKQVPYYHNNIGYKSIHIANKKFMCIGALPPFDHPHVYLIMDETNQKICPYCSTKYHYNSALTDNNTLPAGMTWSKNN
ncbi:zinc-finger domain-containing protein [Bartonella sp. DGB1]|uniref:zinc-finger domain-containing protein n=1 Tax=Bartonella sp. DGB1 TaxID=3239807 RepID=UPI0035259A54